VSNDSTFPASGPNLIPADESGGGRGGRGVRSGGRGEGEQQRDAVLAGAVPQSIDNRDSTTLTIPVLCPKACGECMQCQLARSLQAHNHSVKRMTAAAKRIENETTRASGGIPDLAHVG